MESKRLYEKYKEGKHWIHHPTIYAQSFVRFLKKQNFNGLITDAGCGNGRDLEVFHNAGYETIGIDISTDEINNAKSLHPSIKFKIQNIEHLKFENEAVPAFFCINVMHS